MTKKLSGMTRVSDAPKIPFHRVYTGMPVYNGEQYLEESIQCNLGQTFDDFGLIISDNASTDRTEEICRDFAASDPRVIYIRSPENMGAAQNYLRCFEPAVGEYFRWSNADDLVAPDLIEKCVEALDRDIQVALVYGKTRLIDEGGNFLRNYDDNLHIAGDSATDRFYTVTRNIGLSNVLYGLMRRNLLAKTALFGSYVASDINLIAELSLYGKFIELPEILFSRRMHSESSSHDRRDDERQKNFWDPSKKQLLMQRWRSTTAYYKAVSRAPITARNKGQLYWYLTKTIYWKKAELAMELADYCRFGLLRKT